MRRQGSKSFVREHRGKEITKRVITASGKRSRAAELGVGAESSGGPLSLVAAATSTACAPGRELRCPRFSSFEVSVS